MRGKGSKLTGKLATITQSALKMRRNKKNPTAAQSLGKTTGRWTEEEHQRFNEGKENIQIFRQLQPRIHLNDVTVSRY